MNAYLKYFRKNISSNQNLIVSYLGIGIVSIVLVTYLGYKSADLILCTFFIGITFHFSKSISIIADKQSRMRLAFLVNGQENEKKKISSELHEGVGQMLIALKFKVQEIEDSPTVHELKHLIDETTNEVRRLSSNLMPSVLWDFGLEAALRTFTKTPSLNLNFKYTKSEDASELSMDKRTCLYRIAQESINNTLKHSNTQTAYITVNHSKTNITMTIQDNGIGFDLIDYKRTCKENEYNSLNNCQERIKLLNGNWEIISKKNQGTTIKVSIPL